MYIKAISYFLPTTTIFVIYTTFVITVIIVAITTVNYYLPFSFYKQHD